LEALEDRNMLSIGAAALANTSPVVSTPVPDMTVDQGTVQTSIDLGTVFRDVDVDDALTYAATSPVTITDVVARVKVGAATTAETESVTVDSLREILGTDQAPTNTTARIYSGLLFAHSGNDRSLKGSEHDPAQQSIMNFFTGLGYTVWREEFSYNSTTYYNVVAEKRGSTSSSDVYLVGAHYDTVSLMGSAGLLGSPGADDNGSGVAAMMEMAYALSPCHFDSTIRFVAFDREEEGLFGSNDYVASHSTEQFKGMISLDMVGYSAAAANPTVTFYDVNGNGSIKSDLLEAFNVDLYSGNVRAVDGGQNSSSDHKAFELGGYDAALVHETATNPSYHKYYDSLETRNNIDFDYLANVTKGVTGYLCKAAGLLGRSDLFRATISGSTLTLNYFTGQIGSDSCTVRATDKSGAWVEDTFSVTVRQTNVAPVLTPRAPNLTPITEDDVAGAGQTVASFVAGSISDADAGADQGIAIVAANSGNGLWQFSVDGGATWTALMSTVSENSALLLRAVDKVRFVPDGTGADTASITYHAWDQTAPTRDQQGRSWAVDASGGASPFSTAVDTASLLVVAVNDAPLLDTSGSPTLNAVAEDVAGVGTSISEVIASVAPLQMITDVDPDALQGIAITAADSSFGIWQYTVDGNLWVNVGSVSNVSARLLAADGSTRLRFVPAVNFNMSSPIAVLPTIAFRAWDRSAGANGGVANTSGAGGSSAFSTATEIASVNVWEVNDTPVRIQGTLVNLTVGQNWAATSLGLSGVTYSPGGGGDEVNQTLTYRVTQVPAGTLGSVLLSDGVTQVMAGNAYTLTEIRGMQFRPAANAVDGTGLFAFTATDNGTTNGVADAMSLGQSLSINVATPEAMTSTVGMYDPTSSTFYLRYTNSSGNADKVFGYGDATQHWTPVVGDWNGDGVDGVGFFDPVTSFWYLRNDLSAGAADYTVGYGAPGANWTPLVGDWDGNGTETIGLFDPVNYVWYLRNSLTTGMADWTFGYGQIGAKWTPVVGDWDGNGSDTVGFFDPNASTFYLRNSLSAGYADWTFGYGAPGANWLPVVGDWDANGSQTIGVYDPAGSVYHLRNSLDSGPAELIFGYGNSGWVPLVGRWGGTAQAAATAGTAIQAAAADLVYQAAADVPTSLDAGRDAFALDAQCTDLALQALV
jgi:hypothetical protein